MNFVPSYGDHASKLRASLLARIARKVRAFAGVGLPLIALTAFGAAHGRAQQVESSVPLSQRLTIDLAAGVPGYIGNAATGANTPQSAWWLENSNASTTADYSSPTLAETTDSSAHWQQVGLPYEATIQRTYINQASGGGQGSLNSNNHWYRLHFKVDPSYAGKKFLLELEGAHTGVQVFVNGKLLPGISAVAADAQATHVVGFVPVVVDLTPYLHTDGATDNVVAIDCSIGNVPWFELPGFSQTYRFGQAMTGLFRTVKLLVTNPVHIPLNVYSNTKTWGTYVGTVSVTPTPGVTATAASAVVEVQTNVLNESATTQQVTLTTQIVDAHGDVVVTAPPLTQAVAPMTPATFPSTPQAMFQQQITVPNPTLWYPNNTPAGTPYMYRVYHIVSVNGTVVDSAESPLGIRTVTWDSNFPHINGQAVHLWGGSSRYDYPALGASVPEEQQWRDLAQLAAEGGNVWRPGHSTSSEEFVDAADAYGVVVIQPSGDGEGNYNNPSADTQQLKEEVHRDMIIRDRSHPSILFWEENNGGNNATLAGALASEEQQWDAISPRVQGDRTFNPAYAFVDECDGAGCEVGNKEANPNNPAFGAEYWNFLGTARGLAWDNELQFAAPFVDDWRKGRAADTFGMVQWYFAEEPGETGPFIEFGANASTMQNYVRSLGNSSTDANRFPKLLYYAYQANWIPFSTKPVVALAHHWNRAYEYTAGTPIQENAFSNCPAVRLLINGVAKDPVTGATLADQQPNPWNINSSADLTQNTTVMPGQVHWRVNWAPGTVTAECIDAGGNVVAGASDTRTTAGAENKIVLTAVPELTRPDGTKFQWTSNGADAAFVVAQVEDAQGNLVPTAADNVTFSVSGPATYMGGTQQYVADPFWKTYYQDAFSEANSSVIPGVPYAFFHAPGDPELNFEGGLTKIALRSTFTPGTVTVTASAPGLVSGSVQLTSVAPPSAVQTQPPAIIVPPLSTSVTAGFPATFTVAASGSGLLKYQWYQGGQLIAGATGTSYTTPATTSANNNETFTVTVTSASGYGAVSSNPVTLTVVTAAAPLITTQPASQTVTVGQTATLSVAASGSPQLNYAWYEDGVAVQSGSQTSFTTAVLPAAGSHTVYVIVSNPVGQVQSATAVLTVAAATPVSFTAQPSSQSAVTNEPVQLTAVVAGSAPYTYQWTFTPKGGPATIVASASQLSNIIPYTIPAMGAAAAGAYTVTVNNAANIAITSAPATVSVAPPGSNLALGRLATASSTQNACTSAATGPPYTGTGCLGAENAVDGNLSTRWGSAVAGAPPTPLVPGVDPSWLQVDLGSVQTFNTAVLSWEVNGAYAANYQIQYTSADPATNPVWSVATTNNAGTGNTETLTFPTVQGRYVRMNGTLRGTQYGYSLLEFGVYNVPQLGGAAERYSASASNPALVVDHLLGLTWTSTIKTDTTPGSQFTGVNAAAYCSSLAMRLPTRAEALDISGVNNAPAAFPGPWNTWTSTADPNDASQTAIVGFDGSVTYKVTSNWPGETLCTSGTSSAQAAVVQVPPQPATAALGQSAVFSVTATGKPAPSYQWLKNGTAIPGATSAVYITPPTVSADNGAAFSVTVANGEGSVTTSPVALMIGTAGGGGTPTTPSSPVDVADIDAGSAAAVGSYAADTTCPTGQTYDPGQAITIPAAVASAAAPEKVYESACEGNITYTVGNLVSGNSYNVLLHFAELYFPTAGSRQFDVAINGTPVAALQNFDIFKAAGGKDAAVLETVPSVTAVNNKIVISFTRGAVDQPMINGIEIQAAAAAAAPPVTITTQPQSVTVIAGASATFSVVAGGNGPFTYQWSKNGSAIAGATAATYTTAATVTADNGSTFQVAVSNGTASVVSSSVTLTVSAPAGTTPTITTSPLSQTVTIGRPAQFTVVATGTAPLTYQWSKNGTAIAGATGATYITPGTTAADNGAVFTVVASSGGVSSQPSAAATLTVSTADPSATTYPGVIGTDLNNNTRGAYADSQIYVEVLGNNPANGNALSWVDATGAVHAASLADNTASSHLTGPDGKSYPNYAFTLAQSKLLKLPALSSGRIYISLGGPMYIPVMAGNPLGYAGPNPQNASDANINTHFDWYEFTSGLNADGTPNIYINTTQVDQFGLPLLLDVWDASAEIGLGGVSSNHAQTGINESVAALDAQYTAQTPAAFHLNPVSDLRILAPVHDTFAAGEPNANYFDSYISAMWTYFATNTLTLTLNNGSREFTGKTTGSKFNFTEVNLNNGAYVGGTYTVGEPTTQNVFACDGVFNNDGNNGNGGPQAGGTLAIEVQLCAAFNRHVVQNPAQWTVPADFYLQAPANYYAQFWHSHSVGGLAYGFPYDDASGFSSTIQASHPVHMAFGIGW